jgi:peptidoglycan hydrolase-like protein with peptidoglycan-binding domain
MNRVVLFLRIAGSLLPACAFGGYRHMTHTLLALALACSMFLSSPFTEPEVASADGCFDVPTSAAISVFLGLGSLALKCEPFAVASDGSGPCPITAVGAAAKWDDAGRVDSFDYRFYEPCPNVHARGSYALATGRAEEVLEGNGRRIVAVWNCSNDPWVWSGTPPSCGRVSVASSTIGGAGFALPAGWDQAKYPYSVASINEISRQTLNGQLGNAIKQLPPRTTAKVDDDTEDYGGCVGCGAGPLTGTGFNNTAPAAPPQAPNPSTGQIVQKGANGLNVEAIQLLLNQHGQDVDVDGDFGEQTDGAVRDFQKASGLPQDGKVGPQTWAKLWVTLQEGSTQDDAVQALQTLLNWHNLDVDVDGDFGDQTQGAVQTFQMQKAIPENGTVGTRTWTALVNTP